MSDECMPRKVRTPKPITVRGVWVASHPFPRTTDDEQRAAEFDRMIAAVKADAIEKAAESFTEGGMVHRRLLEVAATYRTPSTTHGADFA